LTSENINLHKCRQQDDPIFYALAAELYSWRLSKYPNHGGRLAPNCDQ
jgi:hypothetical protein